MKDLAALLVDAFVKHTIKSQNFYLLPGPRETNEPRVAGMIEALTPILEEHASERDALVAVLKPILDCYYVGSPPVEFCKNVTLFMAEARNLMKDMGEI